MSNVTYHRCPGVTERIMDDEAFLAHSETGGMFRLNVTGRALWALMENPINHDEAVAILVEAFPDHPREQIAKDVSDVLDAFVENDLAAMA